MSQIEVPTRAKGVVHHMIADVAKGCCREAWENLARQNRFYKAYPNAERFVKRHWSKYIPVARQILIGMLGNPSYPEEKKQIIFEALRLDGAVNPKKMATPAKPSFFLGPKS